MTTILNKLLSTRSNIFKNIPPENYFSFSISKNTPVNLQHIFSRDNRSHVPERRNGTRSINLRPRYNHIKKKNRIGHFNSSLRVRVIGHSRRHFARLIRLQMRFLRRGTLCSSAKHSCQYPDYIRNVALVYTRTTHVCAITEASHSPVHNCTAVYCSYARGEMRRGREGGGGVGGTRYHKSFRAKGSQLSYALKASRVSIGALFLSRYFSLSLSLTIERRIHTECRWRSTTRGAISIITTNVRHPG